MKKIFSILALGALVLFTGCKDDDPDPTVTTIVDNTNVTYKQPTVTASVQTTGTWLASSSASWCILPDEWHYGGRDDATIEFEVMPNKYVPVASRSALISFTSTLNGRFMKVEVTQEALPATADVLEFIEDANFRAFCAAEFGTNNVMTYPQAASVTDMDMSGQGIADLSWGFEYFTGLTSLNCSDNPINALSFMSSHNANLVICPNLVTLDCSETNIATLDVSKLSSLTTIDCSDSRMATLTLGESSTITSINCSATEIATLDVSKLSSLETIDCSAGKLATLKLGASSPVTSINCSNAAIVSIDLSGALDLTSLNIENNKDLEKLDISNNQALISLLATNNAKLKEVKVWDGFNINSPPAGFNIPSTAKFVLAFTN